MKRNETILVVITLALGILSIVDIFKILDAEKLKFLYFISVNILAFYYLLKNKKSIYAILFGFSLLTQIGSILKILHIPSAAVFISVGLLSSAALFLVFVIRPINKKEKKDLNFYLISSISILLVSQWILIFRDMDISNNMILNIPILFLIGILKMVSEPKNKMNKFEFDILTYTFVILFVTTLNHLN